MQTPPSPHLCLECDFFFDTHDHQEMRTTHQCFEMGVIILLTLAFAGIEPSLKRIVHEASKIKASVPFW